MQQEARSGTKQHATRNTHTQCVIREALSTTHFILLCFYSVTPFLDPFAPIICITSWCDCFFYCACVRARGSVRLCIALARSVYNTLSSTFSLFPFLRFSILQLITLKNKRNKYNSEKFTQNRDTIDNGKPTRPPTYFALLSPFLIILNELKL